MERRQYEPASCPAPLRPRQSAEERVCGLTCPLHWCFYTQTQVEYSEDASVEINNIGGQRLRRQTLEWEHGGAHEYAARVLAHFMFLSLSLLHSDSPTLLNLFIFFYPLHPHPPHALSLPLLREALFINQPRPNYTRLAPAPPPYRGSGGPKNTDADWR